MTRYEIEQELDELYKDLNTATQTPRQKPYKSSRTR